MRRWYEERHAPVAGTYLCEVTAVAQLQVKEFQFGNNTHVPFRMFIYNDGGSLRAFMNACPHFNVPLNYSPGDVFTSDRRQFLCMTHYAKFNFTDGQCTEGPCEGEALELIPLRIEGSHVLIGS